MRWVEGPVDLSPVEPKPSASYSDHSFTFSTRKDAFYATQSEDTDFKILMLMWFLTGCWHFRWLVIFTLSVFFNLILQKAKGNSEKS